MRVDRTGLSIVLLAVLAAPVWADEAAQVDPALPSYQKVSGVVGNLNSIGSDTMNNLMTYWAEGFAKLYPNVKIQVEGKGSSTAPPALIARTAQLGPMSRPMKNTEIDQFETAFGHKPTEIRTALDSLAVFVNRDNPLEALSLAQVDAVFSKTRKLGEKESISTWGQVGVKGDLARKPISLYGRNSASGTYGFFKEHVLGNGDFKDEVKEQPGSASVVQGISEDKAGMGYSGIGYRTSGVKALALSTKDSPKAVAATAENVYGGEYPLTRFLLLYVNREPGKPLAPLELEFIKYALSKEGQQVVVKDGYLPLPASVAAEELKKIQ